ncbi:MAG TPA: helix-turn-helix domain-containing protein [Lachnospiraceae bacterium]|nr:helix-turn-helix domain-containing protein [Lachnospiraceae bacterium]
MKYKVYIENIAHMTDGYAYSLHRTNTPKECREALYLHMHSEFEFLYVISGRLDMDIGSEHVSLFENEAVFVPSNVMHKGISDDACEYKAIVFADRFLINTDEIDKEKEYIPFSLYDSSAGVVKIGREARWKEEILSHLEAIYELEEAGCSVTIKKELFIKGHLLLIWQLLHQYHFGNIEVKTGSETVENLKKAILFVEHKFMDQITLDELAKQANMSSSHFCRQFKDYTNLTPIEYVNKYRIMKCCTFLKESQKDVKTICFECGYNNVSFFNREFKKVMGCTPGEYR